jgi:hypothetical protein
MLFYIHIGCMILAALLFLAGVSIARRKVGRGWLKAHKLITIVALASALAAAAVMFMFKLKEGYPHFSTFHSIAGLVCLILMLMMPLAGLLLLRGFRWLRPVHRRAGHILLFLILIAGILGFLSIF